MKKIALIIGVNQYKDPEFKRLNAAVNDAGLIEGIVRECLGFDEVVVERDPAEYKVREALNRIKAQLSAGDLLLFYFAGHGYSTKHDQLLVMADAEHDGLKHNIGIIPLSFVKERTYMPGVMRLCILDCCRSFLTEAHQRDVGAETYLFDSAGVRDLCRVRTKGVEHTPDNNFTVLNACSDGETAHEPKERGLFTQALSDVLRKMKNEEVAIQIGADSSFIQQLSATLKQLLVSHHIQRPQTPSLFPDSLAHPITLYQPPQNQASQKQVPDWKQEEDAWQQASQRNTPESYRFFLANYPESFYVPAARQALARFELNRFRQEEVTEDAPKSKPKSVPEAQPERGGSTSPSESKRILKASFKKRLKQGFLPMLAVVGAGGYFLQDSSIQIGDLTLGIGWPGSATIAVSPPQAQPVPLVEQKQEQQTALASIADTALTPEPEPKIEPEPRLELAPEPLPEPVPVPEAAPEPVPLSDAETKQLQITALQARITARLQLDQLTKPEGESAYDAIVALEALEPTSEFAQTARDSIGFRYAQLIEKTGCNNLTNAMSYLDAGLKVSPESNALAGYQSLAASCAKQAQARERQKAEAEAAATAAATAAAIAAAAQSQSALANRAAYEPTMVELPAGRFQMGCVSGKNCQTDEHPVHPVQVKGFYMSQTEITFAQWDACVAAGACKNKADDQGWGRENRPVINVSWHDIKNEYLPWLNKVRTDKATRGDYRLPTEAQWEYAARAGSEKKYSWGNSIDCSLAAYDGGERSACYYKPNGVYRGTEEVGQYTANAFGLNDMHGNVREWVEDCWHSSYKNAPEKAETAWQGQDGGDCYYRIVRGGSWYNDPESLRSAHRFIYTPSYRVNNFGFRIVQPLIP